MWYDGGWGWGGWLAMTVIMVLFWALLIAGVFALVRWSRSPRGDLRPWPPVAASDREKQRAEDVLAERFARGEIDEDEYRRRLTVLREDR